MKTIVIGSLNTDLIATGIRKFPKPGIQPINRIGLGLMDKTNTEEVEA